MVKVCLAQNVCKTVKVHGAPQARENFIYMLNYQLWLVAVPWANPWAVHLLILI